MFFNIFMFVTWQKKFYLCIPNPQKEGQPLGYFPLAGVGSLRVADGCVRSKHFFLHPLFGVEGLYKGNIIYQNRTKIYIIEQATYICHIQQDIYAAHTKIYIRKKSNKSNKHIKTDIVALCEPVVSLKPTAAQPLNTSSPAAVQPN